MNWDQIQGNWKQFKGEAKRRWGKLTDDDLTTIDGDRDKLLGKLQERYGRAKEEFRDEVDNFCASCEPLGTTYGPTSTRARRQ
jgi:uncharacterized protein YjbJ (UPF0337 family)